MSCSLSLILLLGTSQTERMAATNKKMITPNTSMVEIFLRRYIFPMYFKITRPENHKKVGRTHPDKYQERVTLGVTKPFVTHDHRHAPRVVKPNSVKADEDSLEPLRKTFKIICTLSHIKGTRRRNSFFGGLTNLLT
jgi:hypothetical protein